MHGQAESLKPTARRTRGAARCSLYFGALVLSVLGARPALADPIDRLTGPVWSMWDHSPIIIGGCLLVLAVYLRGFRLRKARGERVNLWRAGSYVSGVLITYLVLQSPMDALSDHVFWIHRVQHVALHHWIPMLLALAAPIPELVRGLPRWIRLNVLRPILRSRGVRGTWSFIQHPVVAPILFVGLIYFWLTPSIFQYATVDGTVHDVMHFSMLIEGIPFWWLMLNPRTGRISYGKRLVILWAIMLPQILAGAYITFTSQVLYPLYAITDQGWVSSYMRDQRLGGLVVWIPASMMSAVAGLIVIRWWIRQVRLSDSAQQSARDANTRPSVPATVADISTYSS